MHLVPAVPSDAAPILPPKALRVFIEGGSHPVAFACPKCGLLHILAKDESDAEKTRKEADAAAHCMKQCICGKPLRWSYYMRCDDCRAALDVQKEKTLFEKATKLSIEDYNGFIYVDGHPGGQEGYFPDVSDLLDWCEDNEQDPPEYAWACTASQFNLNAERILESALEQQDMYEGAFDQIEVKAVKTLQSFFDVWTKELNLEAWSTDYSRVVLLAAEDAVPGSQ